MAEETKPDLTSDEEVKKDSKKDLKAVISKLSSRANNLDRGLVKQTSAMVDLTNALSVGEDSLNSNIKKLTEEVKILREVVANTRPVTRRATIAPATITPTTAEDTVSYRSKKERKREKRYFDEGRIIPKYRPTFLEQAKDVAKDPFKWLAEGTMFEKPYARHREKTMFKRAMGERYKEGDYEKVQKAAREFEKIEKTEQHLRSMGLSREEIKKYQEKTEGPTLKERRSAAKAQLEEVYGTALKPETSPKPEKVRPEVTPTEMVEPELKSKSTRTEPITAVDEKKAKPSLRSNIINDKDVEKWLTDIAASETTPVVSRAFAKSVRDSKAEQLRKGEEETEAGTENLASADSKVEQIYMGEEELETKMLQVESNNLQKQMVDLLTDISKCCGEQKKIMEECCQGGGFKPIPPGFPAIAPALAPSLATAKGFAPAAAAAGLGGSLLLPGTAAAIPAAVPPLTKPVDTTSPAYQFFGKDAQASAPISPAQQFFGKDTTAPVAPATPAAPVPITPAAPVPTAPIAPNAGWSWKTPFSNLPSLLPSFGAPDVDISQLPKAPKPPLPWTEPMVKPQHVLPFGMLPFFKNTLPALKPIPLKGLTPPIPWWMLPQSSSGPATASNINQSSPVDVNLNQLGAELADRRYQYASSSGLGMSDTNSNMIPVGSLGKAKPVTSGLASPQGTTAADLMANSIMAAETGNAGALTDKKRFIRTKVTPDKNQGRHSSAYGPVQMTKGYLEEFKKRNYDNLPKEEQEYLDNLINQGKQMLKNPNDPTLGYGGEGYLGQTERDRDLYSQIAKRSMIDLAHQKKDYKSFISSFRGEEDQKYFNKIAKEAETQGKTPEEIFQELKQMKVEDLPSLSDPDAQLASSDQTSLGIVPKEAAGFFDDDTAKISEPKLEPVTPVTTDNALSLSAQVGDIFNALSIKKHPSTIKHAEQAQITIGSSKSGISTSFAAKVPDITDPSKSIEQQKAGYFVSLHEAGHGIQARAFQEEARQELIKQGVDPNSSDFSEKVNKLAFEKFNKQTTLSKEYSATEYAQGLSSVSDKEAVEKVGAAALRTYITQAWTKGELDPSKISDKDLQALDFADDAKINQSFDKEKLAKIPKFDPSKDITEEAASRALGSLLGYKDISSDYTSKEAMGKDISALASLGSIDSSNKLSLASDSSTQKISEASSQKAEPIDARSAGFFGTEETVADRMAAEESWGPDKEWATPAQPLKPDRLDLEAEWQEAAMVGNPVEMAQIQEDIAALEEPAEPGYDIYAATEELDPRTFVAEPAQPLPQSTGAPAESLAPIPAPSIQPSYQPISGTNVYSSSANVADTYRTEMAPKPATPVVINNGSGGGGQAPRVSEGGDVGAARNPDSNWQRYVLSRFGVGWCNTYQ